MCSVGVAFLDVSIKLLFVSAYLSKRSSNFKVVFVEVGGIVKLSKRKISRPKAQEVGLHLIYRRAAYNMKLPVLCEAFIYKVGYIRCH